MFNLYSPSAGNRCSTTQSAARAERQTVDVRALVGAARRTDRWRSPASVTDSQSRVCSPRERPRCIDRETTARPSARWRRCRSHRLRRPGAGRRWRRCAARAVPRSRRAYSARLSRCSATRPGFGFAAAAWSSERSSHDTKPSTAAWSGRRTPGGGIMPPRSFRTTFSHTSASVGEMREVHGVERDVGSLGALVVAGHAVPGRGARALGTSGRRRGRGGLRGRGSRAPDTASAKARPRARSAAELDPAIASATSAVSALIVAGS